jgi:hypothetical protein
MPRGTAWAGCCVQVVPKGSNINIPMFVMFKNEKCAALTDELTNDRQCLPSHTTGRQLVAKPMRCATVHRRRSLTVGYYSAALRKAYLSRFIPLCSVERVTHRTGTSARSRLSSTPTVFSAALPRPSARATRGSRSVSARASASGSHSQSGVAAYGRSIGSTSIV